jgi:hypothetical protein
MIIYRPAKEIGVGTKIVISQRWRGQVFSESDNIYGDWDPGEWVGYPMDTEVVIVKSHQEKNGVIRFVLTPDFDLEVTMTREVLSNDLLPVELNWKL